MYPSMEGVINLPFQIAHLLVKLRLDDVTRPHEFRSKCFQQFLWILQRTTEVVFEEDDVFSAYNTTGFDTVLSKPVNQMCNASICFKPYDLDSDGVLSLADNCNDSVGRCSFSFLRCVCVECLASPTRWLHKVRLLYEYIISSIIIKSSILRT